MYQPPTGFFLEDLPAYVADKIEWAANEGDEYLDDIFITLFNTPYSNLKVTVEASLDELVDVMVWRIREPVEDANFVDELYSKDVTLQCCRAGCQNSVVGNAVHTFAHIGSDPKRTCTHTPYPISYIALCPSCWHHMGVESIILHGSPTWDLLVRLMYEVIVILFDDIFHDRIAAYEGTRLDKARCLLADLETADLSVLPKDHKGCPWDDDDDDEESSSSLKRGRESEKESDLPETKKLKLSE